MRLIERRETPHCVYSAVWSPAGDELFVGGGFWYGDGFVARIVGGALQFLLKDKDTFSGICFDETGLWLVASVWAAGHRYRPARRYALEGDRLTLTHVLDDDEAWIARMREAYGRGTATGVLIHEGRVIVRRTNPLHALALSTFPAPDLRPGPSGRSANLVGLPGAVVTGANTSTIHRPGSVAIDWDAGGADVPDLPDRLGDQGAVLVLRGDELTALPNPHRRDHPGRAFEPLEDERAVILGVREPPLGWISAIAPTVDGFVTAATDGSIATWRGLRVVKKRVAHVYPISAMVRTAAGRLVSADRSGAGGR
jgi:hypothetical protein